MSATRSAALLSALCLAAFPSFGQEGKTPYYNVKAGPVYITLSSGITTEYTDNVNLSSGRNSAIEPELTITPRLGINALSQLQFFPEGEHNISTLSLSMSLGYRNYVFHPELNRNITDINIAPNSELSFLIRAGHFKIRVHDGFSLESDPVSDGSLSNVAQFRRFINVFGIDTEWDVNKMTTVNLNYAHRNLMAMDLISLGSSGQTTNLNTSSFDNSSDSLSLSAMSRALSFLSLGASASVQGTRYPSNPAQDSTSYSYGPRAKVVFTDYTDLVASCGVTTYQPGDIFYGSKTSGNSLDGSTTQYASLELTNHLNTYYTHSFSVGRQTTLNLIGNQTQMDYARYSSTWKVNSLISLQSGIGVEDNTQLGGVNSGQHYRTITGGVGTQFRLSRKLSTSFSYRYVNKIADDPDNCYKQNTLTWELDYRF